MRPNGSPEELERRRFRALVLLAQGLAPVEVARQMGVDRRSLRRWRATVRLEGSQGLRAQPASGRPRRLDAGAMRELDRALTQETGLDSGGWTCARVANLIEKRFGVRYHPAHVCRLLHGLGYTGSGKATLTG
ncbi:MAG: winged helix-turn-helix domain-containing protein [Terracidiphilus sp.]